MKSKNMNYYFNAEYFDGIELGSTSEKQSEEIINKRNREIVNFCFRDAAEDLPLTTYKDIPGYMEFGVFTLYPGLLIGIGNPHGIAMKGAMKAGFCFDYVTGLPYIPGSSLKGMLRACFPDSVSDTEHEIFIRQLIGKEKLDVGKLMENMFDNNDIFLGAYPIPSESGDGGNVGKLLELEYITPHKERFKNPIPIIMIKVRPGVKFIFSFVFSDYVEDGIIIVSASEKLALCKELVMLMGVGAKTNTGFGRFADQKPKMHSLVKREELSGNGQKQRDFQKCQRQNQSRTKGATGATRSGKCQDCGKTVGIDGRSNKPYKYCYTCSQKHTKR